MSPVIVLLFQLLTYTFSVTIINTPSHGFGQCNTFIDISQNCGTSNMCKALSNNDYDDYVFYALLPFPVNFYGTNYDFVYISTNGVVSPSKDLLYATYWDNKDLASTDPTVLPGWYPFWDDLNKVSTSQIYVGLDPSNSNTMVIQWNRFAHFSDSNAEFTFEIIFDRNSGAFSYSYKNIPTNAGFPRNGGSATVGLRKDTNTFLQYSFNTPGISSANRINYHYTNNVAVYSHNDLKLSSTATLLNFTGDDNGLITINMPFKFYETKSKIKTTILTIANGGIIFFASSSQVEEKDYKEHKSFGGIKTPGIYLFWNEFSSYVGSVRYEFVGTQPHRQVIVQWDRTSTVLLNTYGFPNAFLVSAQAVIDEYSGQVTLRYPNTVFGNAAFDHGANATVAAWFKNNDYFVYSYNQASLCDGDIITMQCGQGYCIDELGQNTNSC